MSELDKAPLLKEKIEVLSGFAFPSSGFNQLDGLPLIRIRDLGGSTTEVRFRGVYDPAYLVSKGDLLVGMDGDFEVHRWEGEDALLNQRVCKISSASKEIHQSFLYWYLKPKIAEIHRRTPQTTVRHLSTKDIYAIDEPPVGFPAQELIAQILNTLDTAIREIEALIDKLKAVKQGLLHDLLTRGIDTNGQLRPPRIEAPELYKDSPLGWIPREWEVSQLCTQTNLITSGSRGWAAYYAENGVLFLRSQNVRMGRLDLTDRQLVKPPTGGEGERTKLEPSDLLITITGNGVGNAAHVPLEWDEPAFVSQHVGLVRFNDPQLALLAAHYFVEGAPGNQQIVSAQYGQSKPGLSLENLRGFWIPVPAESEISLINSKITCAYERLAKEDDLAHQLRSLKLGLMDDLLTGRTRVTPLLESMHQTSAQTGA